MNILVVTGPAISLKEPFDSGIEAFVVSMANQMVKNGHAVDVIAAEAGSNVLFNIIDPFKVPPGNDTNDWVSRQLQKLQFSTLDTSKYDVIHYNMFYPHLYDVGAQFDVPSVITLHSPVDEKRAATYTKFEENTDVRFVAISQRIQDQWESAFDIEIPIIQNGINMDVWSLKRRTDGDYLLWSARINDEKNPAAAIALAKSMNVDLRIAGRITDQAYFDKEIKPHLNDRIQYVGHVTQTEVNNLAANALAFLVTAKWQEPFGLASLEMLASGIPVVGFETALQAEWRHPAVRIAHSTDWHDLVKLVETAAAVSPEQCRAFASSMSVEKMTNDYLRLYRSIAVNEKIDNHITEPSILDEVETHLSTNPY